jgi:Predicted SAM-dependent methyltransferases
MKPLFLNEKWMTGKTVLDIGSHYGLYSILCEEAGATKVIGIEPNQDSFNVSLKLNEIKGKGKTKFINSNFEFITKDTYDLIICQHVYHYVYKTKTRPRFFI